LRKKVSLHKNHNNDKAGQLLAVFRLYISVAQQQKTTNFKATFSSRQMQRSGSTDESNTFNLLHEKYGNKWGAEGGGWQLQSVLLVDGISISNQVAKHRRSVTFLCRIPDPKSACNAGASSSLRTRMNAAARLMPPLRCAVTHLKISQRFLQHASNTQRTQALARQAQSTAQHARRCSSTCNLSLLTRPRVTRSIIHAAQLHILRLNAVCTLAGAVASRWHTNAA
jgi:hypothetical protein